MHFEKKILIEELWKQFLNKIESEWDDKYKWKYKTFKGFNNIERPFVFADSIRKDINKTLDKDKTVSTHSLNQAFQKNGLSEIPRNKTLDIFASYLGYDDWDDFETKNEDAVLQQASLTEIPTDSIVNIPTTPLKSENVESWSSEIGLIKLAERIQEADLVLNTRVVGRNVKENYYTKKSLVWEEAISTYVKAGGIFKEIVSSIFRKEYELHQSEGEGYQAEILDPKWSSFINFTVIHFKDGSKELWFGWLVHEHKGLEQPCFVLKDMGLVQFFENWFYDIFKDLSFERTNKK